MQNKSAGQDNLYASILENSPDFITRYDRDLRYLYVNSTGLKHLGLEKYSLIGKKHREVGVYTPDQCDFIEKRIAEVFETGMEYNGQYEWGGPGSNFWIHLLLTPEYDDGEVVSVLGFSRDISKYKEDERKLFESEEEISKLNADLEKRVQERTRQLVAANKELEAFAYSVSHDLRAPLRAIEGFSKFLIDDFGSDLPEQGRRLVSQIRENTLKMDQLITDILALSRVSRSEHRSSHIDMKKMALSMLNEIVPAETLDSIKISVGELPDIVADPTYMKQVWTNLISNAIKFTSTIERPEITFGGEQGREYNTYYITDNGVGFNPEYKQKLFTVFQRLHKSDEFEGTGVGLAIVQRIIHRHGGEVWAEGEEGKGATFYFSLPVYDKAGSKLAG